MADAQPAAHDAPASTKRSRPDDEAAPATGEATAAPAAAATATAATPPVVLYSYWRSSCSWRVRIALHLLRVPFEYRAVHLLRGGGEQLAPAFAEKNPMKEVRAAAVLRVPACLLRDLRRPLLRPEARRSRWAIGARSQAGLNRAGWVDREAASALFFVRRRSFACFVHGCIGFDVEALESPHVSRMLPCDRCMT